MKILILTEGTAIMHSSAKGLGREDIVKQIKNGTDHSIYKWEKYIPIGNAAEKLQRWKSQGARIFYLTSRVNPEEIEDITGVLKKHNFPEGQLLYRQKGEAYKDVAEKVLPDVLIEDDCESIGGVREMTITNIKPDLKKKVKSIVVQEFEGIDHLPDELRNLRLH